MKTKLRFLLPLFVLLAIGLSVGSVAFARGIDPGLVDNLSSTTEIIGRVEVISSEAWTVAERMIAVNSRTEIKGAIQVGDEVKVHTFLAAGGVLTAREIELVAGPAGTPPASGVPAPAAPGKEVEFTGLVHSMSPDAWMVGDRTVAVTGATEIKGTIAVGALVKVHALRRADGSLLARELELADGADGGTDDRNSGGISAPGTGETGQGGDDRPGHHNGEDGDQDDRSEDDHGSVGFSSGAGDQSGSGHAGTDDSFEGEGGGYPGGQGGEQHPGLDD